MNPGIRWLLLGMIAVSLGMVVAIFYSPGRDMKVPTILSVTGDRLAVTEDKLPIKQQSTQGPTVQQMINSGQLDPPPGNTEKMYSITPPFASIPQTVTPPTRQEAEGNQDGLQQSMVAGALISAQQNTKVAIATAKSNSLPVISKTQENIQVQLPPQVKTPSPPREFESPPGVGSSKGGN